MNFEELIKSPDDLEVFCKEYEDWLRTCWTPFLGGEADEPQT